MTEDTKIWTAIYSAFLIIFIFITITTWSTMVNTKECRMAGIAAKMPTADIIVLCKM